MGRHMIRLLKFAIKYPGWHGYGTDRGTVAAVRRLAAMEVLELNEHRQFRLALSARNREAVDAANKAEG